MENSSRHFSYPFGSFIVWAFYSVGFPDKFNRAEFMLLLEMAALLFCSGMLLLYSAIIVPFQICIWDYTDPCNIFPTLFFDLGVDTFFLVSSLQQLIH
jgi:hypothetical protein